MRIDMRNGYSNPTPAMRSSNHLSLPLPILKCQCLWVDIYMSPSVRPKVRPPLVLVLYAQACQSQPCL